jgi:hypothetical protein
MDRAQKAAILIAVRRRQSHLYSNSEAGSDAYIQIVSCRAVASGRRLRAADNKSAVTRKRKRVDVVTAESVVLNTLQLAVRAE